MAKQKELTEEECLAYLQKEKLFLNVAQVGSFIGFKSGKKLNGVLNESKSGNGYPAKLPKACLPALRVWIDEHRKLK